MGSEIVDYVEINSTQHDINYCDNGAGLNVDENNLDGIIVDENPIVEGLPNIDNNIPTENIPTYGIYNIAVWNPNGWSSNNEELNSFKKQIIKIQNPDIIIIPETHCRNAVIDIIDQSINDEKVFLENFTFFCYNRSKTAANAIRGSGGIAIGINNLMLQTHTIVSVNNASIDGLMYVKLRHIETDFHLGIMGCYLPPDNYLYGRDAEGFFREGSVLWSDLETCDLIVGGGDVNSRTKNNLDYIPEIDGSLVPPRHNPDNVRNSHGDAFIDFLKSNRAVIINGRVTPEKNDFTFVSPRGSSVPDYIFTSLDSLPKCESCEVKLMTDLINENDLVPPDIIPDHSFLTAEFHISGINIKSKANDSLLSQNPNEYNTSKNINKIKDSAFMMSNECLAQVQATILKLEQQIENQATLDAIYADILSLFKTEMDKLPENPVSNSRKFNKKAKEKNKTFWNDELSELWGTYCSTEKMYLNFKCNNNRDRPRKAELRSNFIQAQKHFDKRFRYFKRKHKAADFEELEKLATTGNPDIWKKLKSLCDPNKNKVLLEILRKRSVAKMV